MFAPEQGTLGVLGPVGDLRLAAVGPEAGHQVSFLTPLTIMAPIPLTLVDILPAHGLMGAMAGEVASTLLSRMAVPVLYSMAEARRQCEQIGTKGSVGGMQAGMEAR